MSAMGENYQQPFRFTSQNSREMAAKSWEARRERKAKLETEAAKGRQFTPQSERLALQIERVECMMEKTEDPSKLEKLSATHTRLFKAWQVLTGTPNPGSLRARKAGQGEPMRIVVPVPIGETWRAPSLSEPKSVEKPVIQGSQDKTVVTIPAISAPVMPKPPPEQPRQSAPVAEKENFDHVPDHIKRALGKNWKQSIISQGHA